MLVKALGLFMVTALAEIVGCYLVFVVVKRFGSPWLLLPAACSLAFFSWLLTLHPTESGRVYAAYGGIYVAGALLWLRLVDGVSPLATDIVGVIIVLLGMAIIVMGGWQT